MSDYYTGSREGDQELLERDRVRARPPQRKNLYALTRGGPYPAYVSVNREANGKVGIIVRGPGKQVGFSHNDTKGPPTPIFGHDLAAFEWTAEEFEAFKKEINQ